MNYKCPFCGKSMGKKLMIYKPYPGDRKILPAKALPVCPYCDEELEINFHPMEKLKLILGVGPVLIILAAHLKSNILFIIGTFFLGITFIGLFYINYKYFRNWPRFKKRVKNAL